MSSRSRSFTKDEQAEQRAKLRKMLKPGSTVHVVQRHVARSGMMRHLSLFFIDKKGGIHNITWAAAAAMGDRVYDDGHWTLHVGGAGMDMHFGTVYNLSRALYRDGVKCTGSATGSNRCTSNDHSNDYGTAKRAFDAKMEAEGREWPARGNDREPTPEYSAMHAEMREYIENRLATDLGYRKDRVHSDGGYALNYNTL